MANPVDRPQFRMSDEHRLKIQNSNILSYLIEHITGDRKMSQTQVTAGIALMKKTLPDLAAVTVSGNPDSPVKMVIEWQKKQES